VCILFSHIQAPQTEYNRRNVEECESWKTIDQYQKRLSNGLEEQQTLLLLFYDAGWVEYMNAVGRDLDFDNLTKGLGAALRMSDKFGSTSSKTSWVRVVTTKELAYFVNTIRGDQPGETALRWRRFFVSDQKKVFYDCSKVIEAIIRLRHIGSGIPVLRIDKDVLDALTDQEEKQAPAGVQWLARMLDRAKKNHRHCIESSDVYSFVFSGGYRDEGEEETPQPQGFCEWATAYSTRVYPAVFATKGLLEHSQKESLFDFAKKVDESGAFHDLVATRFYGFGEAKPAGIIEFGAHPRKAVISGSLFCLSDGTILDLPPFSNFESNVIWIDDHLKYALLKDLGQVGQRRITVPSLDNEGETRTLTARIPHCYLPKGRQSVENFGFYVLGVYLPSLLRGIIMDRWICSNPDEKLRALPSREPGALVSALREALARGRLDEKKREQLRQRLSQLALERIEEVWKAWRDLGWSRSEPDEQRDTFASIWVDGRVREYSERIGATIKDGAGIQPPEDWIGWGLLRTPEAGLRGGADAETITYDKLTEPMRRDLDTLIEDAVTYVDWALQWPQFVQAIRVLEPKAVVLDLRENWG
jgi:hypothetical protein